MDEVPENLMYSPISHAWIFVNKKDGVAIIGITHPGQELMGRIVKVGFPRVGTYLARGEKCLQIEAEKGSSEFVSPISGEVLVLNEKLLDNPGIINESPYARGWLMRVKIKDEVEIGNLKGPSDYKNFLIELEAKNMAPKSTSPRSGSF